MSNRRGRADKTRIQLARLEERIRDAKRRGNDMGARSLERAQERLWRKYKKALKLEDKAAEQFARRNDA